MQLDIKALGGSPKNNKNLRPRRSSSEDIAKVGQTLILTNEVILRSEENSEVTLKFPAGTPGEILGITENQAFKGKKIYFVKLVHRTNGTTAECYIPPSHATITAGKCIPTDEALAYNGG